MQWMLTLYAVIKEHGHMVYLIGTKWFTNWRRGKLTQIPAKIHIWHLYEKEIGWKWAPDGIVSWLHNTTMLIADKSHVGLLWPIHEPVMLCNFLCFLDTHVLAKTCIECQIDFADMGCN